MGIAMETTDLRDTLSAAYDEASSESVQPAQVVEAPEKIETTKTERTRDTAGKFVKKETTDESPAEPDPGQVEPAEIPGEVKEPEPEPKPVKKPPQSWRNEIKTFWEQLPVEVQDEVLRRDSEYSKGIQRYAELAKYGESLKSVIDPWTSYLQQLNTTPDQAFKYLIGAEYTLRTGSPAQKLQALQTLARDYAIDLNQSAEQAQVVDPNLAYALQQVNELRQTISQQQNQQQQLFQQQQQSELAAANDQIQAFREDSSHPHFDEVCQDMGKLIETGYASNLEDAYDKACWARADIRSSLLKNQEAKRIQEQVIAANQAKAKTVSVRGAPAGAAVNVPKVSIREELLSAWNDAE